MELCPSGLRRRTQVQWLWVRNHTRTSVLRSPLNRFHRLSQTRCYFGSIEVQGISHRSDWCVRGDEEPAFIGWICLNDVKLNDNNNNNNTCFAGTMTPQNIFLYLFSDSLVSYVPTTNDEAVIWSLENVLLFLMSMNILVFFFLERKRSP